MNYIKFIASFVIAFLFLDNFSHAEVVKFKPCLNIDNQCTIHELRVIPCKEGPKGKPCKLKKGTSVNIEVDFTPDFSCDKMYGGAFYDGIKEIEWPNMNSNACSFTSCPIVKGKKLTYVYSADIAKKYPSGLYNVNYKFGPSSDDIKCCLSLAIKM